MEPASISAIRNEIRDLQQEELQSIILRLARYRKENKELISYLLYNAADETTFIRNGYAEMDKLFSEINKSSYLYIKKSLRKILRITNQYIKFSGSPKTEVELLLHFCKNMRNSGLKRRTNPVIWNIYQRQTFRINKALKSLHADLQFDYSEAVDEL